jgi:hypothetical protein
MVVSKRARTLIPRNKAAFRNRGLIAFVVAGVLVAGCGGDSNETTPTAANAGARLAASSAAQPGAAQPYSPNGRIVADSGFRPDTDGFSFENYGPGTQDLTVAEMVDLFGSGRGVCASGQGPSCVLTPPAEAWMAMQNQAMQGGHCTGFSITALMMFQKLLDPLRYGGPSVPALALYGNPPLQGRIAESWVLWESPRIQLGLIRRTPNQMLAELINKLGDSGETYTLAMYASESPSAPGHAVTPYAVEDLGGGKLAVLIYDNNYPQITRAVMFDRNGNSWSYDAAPNPDQASALWSGQGTINELILLPTTPGLGIQPCPFCSTPGRSGTLRFSANGAPSSLIPGKYEEIALAADTVNHGHLVITDTAGRKTGFVNGEFVNQIPGARVTRSLLARNYEQTPEPRYRVPRDKKFTITLDGDPLKAPDKESVTVIGPGYSVVASNITLRPGRQVHLRLSGGGTALSYRAGPGQTQLPHIEIGLQRPGSDYRFAVSTPPIKGGSTLTAVAKPEAQQLKLDAAGVEKPGEYGLAVTQLRPSGAQPASGRTVRIPGGGSAQLDLSR